MFARKLNAKMDILWSTVTLNVLHHSVQYPTKFNIIIYNNKLLYELNDGLGRQ